MARKADWIDSFMDYTEDSEAPSLYREWAAYFTIAACLQRKCFLSVGFYTFYPNLYVILVGPSGSRKNTAMDPSLEFLREISEVRLAAKSTTREALIGAIERAGQTDVDPLSQVPVYKHSSLTVFSEEFSVFLGYKNKNLITDLIDLYDSPKNWDYDTKHQGTNIIANAWLNILGGTTPDNLMESLPTVAIGGGLAGRIVFVYEEGKEKTVSPFDQRVDRELWESMATELLDIVQLQGQFTATPEFEGLWTAWYKEQSDNPPFEDHRLNGYMSRRQVHALKLSMISSASRSEDMIVSKTDFDRALNLLERTEVKMAKTFSGLGRVDYAPVMQRVMTTISIHKQVEFGDLMRLYHSDASPQELGQMVIALRDMNPQFCTVEGKGRKAVITYALKDS